jgi:hypothetical protein
MADQVRMTRSGDRKIAEARITRKGRRDRRFGRRLVASNCFKYKEARMNSFTEEGFSGRENSSVFFLSRFWLLLSQKWGSCPMRVLSALTWEIWRKWHCCGRTWETQSRLSIHFGYCFQRWGRRCHAVFIWEVQSHSTHTRATSTEAG